MTYVTPSYAKQLALELDCYDGKDGKIDAETWNNKFKAKEKGGKKVRTSISVFDAEKSIQMYLRKTEQITGESQETLYSKWLNDIKEMKTTQNTTVATEDDSNENNGEINYESDIPEIVITSTSRKKYTGFSISNNIPQALLADFNKSIEEKPVSTFVAKTTPAEELSEADINKTLIEKPNIDEYAELAKMTKTSSAKASGEQINEDILDRAFDNVIKDLMKKGNKLRSVLIGTAKEFLAAANRHDVDTFTLMGISMIESSYGTSKMALTKNNVGGLTPNGRTGITCQTVGDSINIAAKTLHINVYDKGLDSINSVGMKGNYCCADSNRRAAWVSNVTFFANKVRTEYNRLLLEMQAIS